MLFAFQSLIKQCCTWILKMLLYCHRSGEVVYFMITFLIILTQTLKVHLFSLYQMLRTSTYVRIVKLFR